MFKTIKKFTSCFLVLCMLLSIVPMGVFATETETINYVSIGDSMTNGYCFDGYNQGGSLPDFINDNDNGVYGDAAYPELIADWLEGSYATVNHTRLAPSAMRAEDLLYLLGGRETPADDWYGQVENYTNCYDDAALSEFFTDSVTEADLITMGIGNASFGAFLLQHVTDAIGVMGNAPDIDPDITLANALELIDAEQQDVVMQVYDYMAEELGKYIPADMQATYNIPAVLDITAYTAAGFILNYKNVIERIVELNPDVEIVLVGLMNTTYGMNITADDMPSIPVGDIMDNVFGVLNAYIAGLPAVMQRAGNYSDAKFYYSEIDDIEFIVQKFDDLKAANWASIDGLSGTTVRSRTITSYNNSLRGVINSAFGSSYPAINLADVQNFENAQESGYDDDWMTIVGGAGMAPDVATSAAIYLAIEDALAASVGEMDIPLDDLASIAGDISGIFSGLSVDTTSPATVRSSLATYLSAEEFKPLCKIYSLFKIGDGMSVHPTPAAHAALAAKIISAYENGYTAEDETIENIKEAYEDVKALILEYYDEAYAKAYEELDKKGYVDTAANGIDAAINAILTIDVSDTQMTDEFKAELTEELATVVVTLTEIKAILENDTAKDVDGLLAAVAGLEDDLWLHLANAGAILDQAGYDVKTLVGPIVDAYIIELLEAAYEAHEELKGIIDEVLGVVSFDELKAKLDAYVEEIKAKSALEFAKLGHKHYEADADSFYLAIGGDTLHGTGLNVDDLIAGTVKRYNDLVKSELEIANGSVVKKQELLATEVVDLITSNASNIAAADLITYQLDASAFVNALFSEEAVEWSKYIDPEVSELFNVILEEATEILTADWATYANAEIDEVLAAVIPQVQPVVAEYVAKAEDAVAKYITVNVDEAKIDSLIAQGISCVREAIDFVAAKKDGAYTEAVATIEGIDDMIINYAEKLAYACVAYAMDTVKAVETIQAINPDATVLVVGMYNPLVGLEIVVNGETIDAGGMFENVINVTNAFYYTYAAVNGRIAFVDVADTEINGFDAAIQVSDLDALITVLPNLLRNIDDNMHATAAGHEYIKDQIVKALTCDYSVCEQLDADNHAIKCSICGYAKPVEHERSYEQLDATNHTVNCLICGYTGTETHSFSGKTCTLCGYTKTSSGGSNGGGAVSNQFTIKFETNGGSEVAKVVVKKGELLAEPVAPTKAGYAFAGWYTDKALAAKYDFSTPVTKFFTLYAKWTDAISMITDIDQDAWYYEYVKKIMDLGYMKGISATEFAPNAALTRGMFVTILHRIEGEIAVADDVNFTDVAADQYYANAVKWANANGIVKGISDTEFAPNAEVTREQMAAMLARYAEYKKFAVAEEGDVTYTDSDEISEYAKDAVKIANKLGILIGNADGSFAPKKNATRAEAAALFVRLLDVLAK